MFKELVVFVHTTARNFCLVRPTAVARGVSHPAGAREFRVLTH